MSTGRLHRTKGGLKDPQEFGFSKLLKAFPKLITIADRNPAVTELDRRTSPRPNGEIVSLATSTTSDRVSIRIAAQRIKDALYRFNSKLSFVRYLYLFVFVTLSTVGCYAGFSSQSSSYLRKTNSFEEQIVSLQELVLPVSAAFKETAKCSLFSNPPLHQISSNLMYWDFIRSVSRDLKAAFRTNNKHLKEIKQTGHSADQASSDAQTQEVLQLLQQLRGSAG